MPNETRNYVPKLQAVKNIVDNPEGLRAELPLIENHPYFQSVSVIRDIHVELAEQLSDVSVADFKGLNLSMKRPVILAAGTPKILLPWDNAKIFQRNFEAYTEGHYASWTAWSAPVTMSASEAARRVGMKEADLRTVNTIPPRMLIKVGSVLIVPRSAKVQNDVTSHVADNGQLKLSPERVTRRTWVKARQHDTVASIARRFWLSAPTSPDGTVSARRPLSRRDSGVVVYLPVKIGVRSRARAGGQAAPSSQARRARRQACEPC